MRGRLTLRSRLILFLRLPPYRRASPTLPGCSRRASGCSCTWATAAAERWALHSEALLRSVFLALLLALGLAAHAQDGDKLAQYRLGGGDSIRISVFQNPNLTLETRVAEDGAITYPLIGRMAVGGTTIAEAERAIARALESGNFIRKPQVSILLLQTRSAQVSVLGLVNRAGRYPLDTVNLRVSEVIAIAGGVAIAGGDLAILTGERAGKPFRREIDIAKLFDEKGHAEDIAVAGGDVIYVERAPSVYVYGEVNRPGAYRLERGTTFRQALARGGGPTQRGTERSLRVHRRGADGVVQVLKNPGLDELARPEDVLHVGESLF